MKRLTAAIVAGLIASVTTSLAYADKRHVPKREFNRSTTVDTPRGQYQRNLQQQRHDTGFSRHRSLTTPSGKTATRDTVYSRDPDNKTATRTTTGTRLNGNTYSGERVLTRTENGYTNNHTRTNNNGDTASRNAVVNVDREAGQATKTVTRTNFAGETYTKDIVINKE